LIIVTSDHGEAFGEHKLAAHGVSTYQDQVYVPLIIKYPSQTEARIAAVPVSHVDILPTVLDTLGIPVPPHILGRSLRSDSPADRAVFAESFPTKALDLPSPRLDRIERAIRLGTYKLVVSDKGKHELFDLVRDPQELHSLSTSVVAQAQFMETLLENFLRTAPKQHDPKPTNREQMKLLKGLGYVH